MNKINQILMLFLLLYSLPGWAQQSVQINVKGKVMMENTKQPLQYAGISLRATTDPQLIKTAVTDSGGFFTVTIPPGRYDIKIESIAYQPQIFKDRVLLNATDLGNILLKEDVKMLKAVDVVGEKSNVELKLDKKIFNVGKDLVTKGGSANDILNNVPSVNVDASGGVSLRGNGNVRVLINGKPSMLTQNNGLEQIPAALIEKVEVITNPSAGYEAQGSAGIINIILKKNASAGFNASLQVGVGNPANYNTNVNASYKTEKLNLFSNIGYRYRNAFGDDKIFQQAVTNGTATNSEQYNKQGRNDDQYNFYFGGDYYVNAKNTLTGSYYRGRLMNTDTTSYNYHYYHGNRMLDSTVFRFENYKEPQIFNQLELNYVKTFNKKDQKWSTNLRYDFWNDDENQDIRQQKAFPGGTVSTHLLSRDIESSNDIYLQSDFVSPVGKDAKLQFGLRADLRAIRSDYQASADGVSLQAFTNKLKYDENLYSGYLQYGGKIKHFNYQLGLRAEGSVIRIADRTGVFNRDKQYLNLFPTAHFTYALSETSDLQLSYSRRINRPKFWQLNPFAGLSDTRNLVVGNPDLDPMYTNSFELAFLKRWGKLTLNPSVYVQHTTNYFQYILKRQQDGSFVEIPVNLDQENRFGAELNTSYNPFSWWRLSVDFNYYRYTQRGRFEAQDYTAGDQTWFTRIGSRMKFPSSLSVEYTFNYQGSNVDIQSVNKAQYRANLGVGKDFFKDKVSLVFAVNNIFDSQRATRITTTERYRLEATYRGIGRQINLNLIYRFNRKKEDKDRVPEQL